jgi:hypothetical protein
LIRALNAWLLKSIFRQNETFPGTKMLRWTSGRVTSATPWPFFVSVRDMVLKNAKVGSGSTVRKKRADSLNGRETAAFQRRTRQQHAQERAQDYVEAIADLIAFCGEARATDLAKSLGVTHVTVIRTVQRLQRDGLVTTQPYRSIFLTDAGRKLAAKAKACHEKSRRFSGSIGCLASHSSG